jgi:hypothetical protein
MSYGAVEQLFYDVSTSRNRKEAFREDAGEVAGKYALSETEREMVISMQVENLFAGRNQCPNILPGFPSLHHGWKRRATVRIVCSLRDITSPSFRHTGESC